jgi:hypothetical protein
MMSTEAKREYQRIWRAKKKAEKQAHAAVVLAKQARNGKAHRTMSEGVGPGFLGTPECPTRWRMTDGTTTIDLGSAREGIVVAIDGRTVVNLITGR